MLAAKNKSPDAMHQGFLAARATGAELLQLGFLVDHVLAGNRVELFDFHLARHGPLVLGGGVEVTGAGGRFQFDLVAHGD